MASVSRRARICSPTCLRQTLVHFKHPAMTMRLYALTDGARPFAGIPVVSSDLFPEPLQRDQGRDLPYITPEVIRSSSIYIVFIHARATECPRLDAVSKATLQHREQHGRTFIVHELVYVRCVGGTGDPSGSLRPVHMARGCGSDNAYIVGK